jgi:hypothetical protein
MCRSPLKVALLVVACLVFARVAAAQSAIAGVVRDATGAVLPGVTVEVASPALIEKVKSTVTDPAGQYRVVDLRPGTYSVTFALSGFATVKRDGIVLEANFTAPVNAEMRVGAISETVTVSGETPVVDVQTTQHREVVTRQLLDTLPTGRDFQTVGNVLPSVNMGRYDVGGTSTAQSGTLVAFGGRGADFQMKVDGMPATNNFGEGWFNGIYHNEAAYQEMAYTVSGGSAEMQSGGVQVNLVPRTGGNKFTFEFLGTYANDSLQSSNIDAALQNASFKPTTAGISKLWDSNLNSGGPIIRDRLWYFGTYRYWGNTSPAANVYYGQSDPRVIPPGARQAADDNDLYAGDIRLTTQLANTRVTGSYDNGPRWRRFFGIENGGGSPESFDAYPNESYIVQFRTTTSLTSKLLLETGFTRLWWWSRLDAQPEVRLASCFVAFDLCRAGTNYGDIRKTDLTLGWNYNAPGSYNATFAAPRNTGMVSLSYVTGAHNMKVGWVQGWGYRKIDTPMNNAGLTQRYRLGVPDSVVLSVVPSFQDTTINPDLGLYIQDTWTRGRLTMNPGLRYDYIHGTIEPQTAAAGRFLPVRVFTEADYVNVPSFSDISPRFGASYDLFGNGKTAVKGSVGKYVQSFNSNLADDFNPMGGSTDTRTWVDRNGDDIAQESELGPSTNLSFGKPSSVPKPDPNLKRPYQILYNGGIQHELRPGLSVAVDYYYRQYYRMFFGTTAAGTITDQNTATTFNDYSPLLIPDPRGNGQTITVYSISPSKLGLVNLYRTNSSTDFTKYSGVDITMQARLKNGTQVQGGVTTGRVHQNLCDMSDPNQLRFCDATYPWLAQFKLSGTYPLPYGFRVSGLFQSLPGTQQARDASNVGKDIAETYSVGRAVAPTLTQPSVSIRLNEPGSVLLARVNQLDISLSRDFQFGRTRVRPQIDVFNALNDNSVIQVNTTYGPSLLQPQFILNPRLVRFNVRVSF